MVFVKGKGIVLQEPSVVAVSVGENRILSVGNEAKEMMGRTPDTIKVYRPLRKGVIADYRVTQAMIRHFIDRTTGPFRFLKPELMIGVPACITSTERRAVIKAALGAGAKAVYTAKEPILAALGAGIPINECSGNMIVDIGGGTSEVAVISLGGIVASRSIRIAGDEMDRVIADHIKEKYGLAIGEQTAETIKIKIGTALPLAKEENIEIKGRDLVSGLPRNVKVGSNEICGVISDVLNSIVHVIRQVLRETPPELSADIMDKGMFVSGGSSLLRNIEKMFSSTTGVPSTKVEEPLFSVAKGTGILLESLDVYKRSIMRKK